MSFRFWKRIKIAPGLTLNLSKSGGSLSIGPRGAKFTVGSRGKCLSVGIPGTGIFYTTRLSGGKSHKKNTLRSIPTVRPEDRLKLGFFKRLITPGDEEALVDGLRELATGNKEKAMEHFKNAMHLADGAFLAGFLALWHERFDEAENALEIAARKHENLGFYFSKYGIDIFWVLPITDELTARVEPDLRGVLLGLVELYQRLNRRKEAIARLEELQRLEPEDPVVKLSLAELLLDAPPDDKTAARQVVHLSENIQNDSPVHAALLLYKARAFRRLGLPEAARETLTVALRRKKGRSDELLQALRYERALAYEDLGRHARARSDLEKLYARNPDYADVAARLGLKND